MNDIPPDLTAAVKAAGLAEFFGGCTTAHQREYLKWISEAKRPETRKNRIERTIKMLAAKCAEEKARAKKNGRSETRMTR
jgi:uncharacterized protein YdeI (YjbR/CyaY-like superfamily)